VVARTANEAARKAHRYTTCQPGMCLMYTRTWLDIDSKYPSAIAAWEAAKGKHRKDRSPPRGAPVFYAGGNYGHIALSLGKRRIRSTDCRSSGRVTDTVLSWPEHAWGQRYLGWTETLNGVAIPFLRDDPQPEKREVKAMGYNWLTWLPDALRAEGCTVKAVDGWKNRGRPAATGSFEPYGVLWHHTAGAKTSMSNPAPSLGICINGRSDLPGPLAQVLIGYDGTCHVIAAGRANHAGASNGFGPFAVGDGNEMMVGFEIDYDGVTQHMSSYQQDAAVRASAACLKRFRKDARYAAGHKETSVTGKIDPYGITGDGLRDLVRKYMQGNYTPASGGGDDPLAKYDTDAELSEGVLHGHKWKYQDKAEAQNLQEQITTLRRQVDNILDIVKKK
jgi:N-acetylmuramoyl-L-alanine amidase